MVAFAHDSIMSVRDVECATTIARIETARRVRLGHVVASDCDDHIQDLLVGVVAKWPRYDSHRAKFSTFFAVVAQREACSLVRSRCAAKRGGGRAPISLDRCSSDEESLHSRDADSDPSQFDLRDDVQSVIDRLPSELRRFAYELLSKRPAAAARSLKLTRSAATAQMRELREQFEAAGLRPC